MPNNSPTSPSGTPAWWSRDEISIAETFSGGRPSSVSALSDGAINSSTPRRSINWAGASGSSTPDIKHKLQYASPATARQAALRMYETLKRHGLRNEAGKALTGGGGGGGNLETEETEQGKVRRSEELVGMEYLMKDGFADYLQKMARILPPIPQQIVRFSGVKYSKKIETSSNDYETFGNKMAGCIVGPLRKLYRKKNTMWLDILKGVDGYIMPGSVTLVLGPPGSGKSTFLEILANKAEENSNAILQGLVMYNNNHASEVCSTRMIADITGQINKHIPFLSVRETLEFARDCTQGLRPENLNPQLRKFFAHALVEGQDPFIEHILEILNLKKIENQLAGVAISSSDHQNLTMAELLVGTYAMMIYDQPLSGCDLAATYDLVGTIKTISRIQQSSAVMSLTQLSEEVFNLFDRIIVLGDGQVVFQGLRQDAIPYFSNLGYKKPSFLESAEFLEDIVNGNGCQYMETEAAPLSLDELVGHYKNSNHYQDVMRIITQDYVKHTYWVESGDHLGLSLRTLPKYDKPDDGKSGNKIVITKASNEMREFGGEGNTSKVHIGDIVTAVSFNNEETRYLVLEDNTVQNELSSQVYTLLKKKGPILIQIEHYEGKEQHAQFQLEQFHRPYVQTWWQSTRTLIRRQIKITKRLRIILMLRLFQAIVLGIFSGTLFYQLGGKYNQQKMNSVRALGFVSTMSILLINLVQFPLYMLQRPVFYKHQAQRFFRASSYLAAHCILNMPQAIIEAMVYTLCMYFFAGLSLTRAAFFEFLLLLILVAYFGSSVFFFLSAVSPILEAGNALAGLLVSIFLLFSGFVIYPSNIPAYFKWMMYANPIHWANISFCQTQFENYIASCSDFIGKLPFCNQFPGITVGKAYLEFYEVSSGGMRSWLPYIIIVGWIVVANMLALFGLKKLEFTGTIQSVPQIKRTHKRRNFITDVENEFRSASSYSEHPDQSSEFKGTILQTLKTAARKIRDDRGDIWIDEFRIDIEKSELEIHFEPAVLLFEDLSFTRYNKASKESVSVFNNISGYVKPQYMLAILGGSQMCRSTLLRCLAARTPSNGNLKGHVQINTGKPGKSLNQLVGYVEKLDAHQPYLSVLESLQFSCALRLGKDIDARRRNMYVEMVLEELGLLPYSNQLVSSLRDSTGRTFEIAKKLSIGIELVANPSILFLEEPIFDLDITATQNILTILARLSESDHTIIATLTHPNMRSLSYFDHALILTREGEQAFFGPIGADCRNLTSYFSEVPKTPKYHLKHTPISFVMDLLGQGIKHKKATSVNFAEIYGASTLHDDNTHEINRLKECSTKRDQKHQSHTYPASYLQQANLVMLRTQKFLWRNVQYTYSRLIACIMIGFLMGSLYFQIEYKDTYGVTSRSLYIYMQVMLIGVVSANNIIPQIGSDRLVYFREWRARMYHPIFYPLSWAICEIPYFLIATLALVGIGNSMAGIGTGSATDFITYWIVLLLFTLSVTYFGMMVTFLASLPTFAAFLVSIITSLWVSAAGVIVLQSEIKFYRWMYWSNPFQYAINALTSIAFYCETQNCGSVCQCPRLPDSSYVWDTLSQIRSLNHSRIGRDMLTLSFMSLLFVCLSFLFFVSLKHNRNHQS